MAQSTYLGGCHCGAVRYRVEADLGQVMVCNCSICSRRGHALTFAPEAKFTLLSGEQELSDYQFGAKAIHHLFCRTCGVGSFGRGTGPDGSKMVAVNVRCLDDVEMDNLQITAFDGKSL